jgi:hypothetical protein
MTWLTVLKAAHGLELSKQERKTFKAVAGGRKPPKRPCRELWAVIGMRSGKTRMAGATAAYVATFIDHRRKLAAGERGYILTLSPSLDQARIVFDYAHAFLDSSPILRRKIVDVTATEIRLENNITICSHANSFRTVRGRALLGCVFDESAFWRDESSALPDTEAYRAVLPSLASTGGMLIGISSPHRRVGLLHAKHRDHYGQDGDVLVVQGPTELFNPCIDPHIIAEARRNDPVAASANWDGLFRADLTQFIADDQIDCAVDHGRPMELPPQSDTKYFAFVDASAGRHDHFTLCVGHKHQERFIADVIRGRTGDPNAVTVEYAALCKQYHIAQVTGDNFAGEWVAGAFRKCGLDYRRSTQVRSQLYLAAMPFFMRGAVSIPDHSRLIRELRLLERSSAPSGRDTVDHGRGGSDDYANALCGCMQLAMREPRGSAFDYVYLPGFSAKVFDGDGAQLNSVRLFGGVPAGHVLPDSIHWADAQGELARKKAELEARMNRKPGEPPAPPSPYAMFSSKCFGA